MVGTGGAEEARLLGVLQIGLENVADALAVLGVLDGEDALDAAEEVPWHPVGAAGEDSGPGAAAVFKIEDAAVLEVAAKNTAHADVLADAFNAGHEHADAAHDEVDLHTGLRGLVELFDGLPVDEAVGLDDDAGGFAGPGLAGFLADVFLDGVVEVEGGHQ